MNVIKILNDLVLDMLNKINIKYDLQKCSFSSISLNHIYDTLQFLNKCKEIKWTSTNQKSIERKEEDNDDDNNTKIIMISNTYVSKINKNALKYLIAYGKYLEHDLNDLLRKLQITDTSKDLNDTEFKDCILNTSSKLNDCLRAFRDISTFDKIHIKKAKQIELKLASKIFTNYQISSSIDNYIDTILANHKNDILINYNHWKEEQIFILPLLHFVCFHMNQSGLDRYISSKQNHQQTYYQISSKIDAELNEFCDANTKQIVPLFQSENGTANQLEKILQNLQKAANTNPSGIVYVRYRGAVKELSFIINTLMAETRTKLVTEINKNHQITNEIILSISNKLQSVKKGVTTIIPHLLYLKADDERKKIEKEEKALGLLTTNRVQELMTATLQSLRKRNFIQCIFCLSMFFFCCTKQRYFYIN